MSGMLRASAMPQSARPAQRSRRKASPWVAAEAVACRAIDAFADHQGHTEHRDRQRGLMRPLMPAVVYRIIRWDGPGEATAPSRPAASQSGAVCASAPGAPRPPLRKTARRRAVLRAIRCEGTTARRVADEQGRPAPRRRRRTPPPTRSRPSGCAFHRIAVRIGGRRSWRGPCFAEQRPMATPLPWNQRFIRIVAGIMEPKP